MKKKLMSMILITALSLSITACGNSEEIVSTNSTDEAAEEDQTEESATAEAAEEVNDGANEYYETGRSYLYGTDGKEVNFEEAYSNFEKAEEAGKTEANFYLGILCDYYGYPQTDFAQAKTYYEACGDNPYAQISLGYLYYHGQGVEEDEERAKELFQAAIDQGCVEGYSATASIALYEENYEKAWEDANKALEGTEQLYLASAMSTIGRIYQKGLGPEQDYDKALEWFQKAADAGYEDAEQYIEYVKSLM